MAERRCELRLYTPESMLEGLPEVSSRENLRCRQDFVIGSGPIMVSAVLLEQDTLTVIWPDGTGEEAVLSMTADRRLWVVRSSVAEGSPLASYAGLLVGGVQVGVRGV